MTNDELQKAINTVAEALNLGLVDLVDETKGPHGLPVRRLEISYNGPQFAVRIKPKPREVWISYDSTGNRGGTWGYKPTEYFGGEKIVKFREVLE